MNQKFASQSPIQYRGDLVDVVTSYIQCPNNFVASCILPYARTNTCEFTWHKFNLEQGFEDVNADVVDNSRVHEVSPLEAELMADKVEDQGLDVPMTWCTKQAMNSACSGMPEDVEVQETLRLASLVMLQREKKTLDLVLDPAQYTTNTGNGTNMLDAQLGNLIDLATIDGGNHEFNGTAPYDPLIALTSLIGSSVFPITHMATNKKVMAYLRTHPAFIANGALDVVTANQQIAADLGLMGICEGQTFSSISGVKTPLFGNFILLYSKSDASTVDCKVPTFGFTAKLPENGSLDQMYVGQFESWAHGLKGTTFIRVGEQTKPIVAHFELGILIQNPLV